MLQLIRATFLVFVLALTAFIQAAPASAGNIVYLSSSGNDSNPCTGSQPCATFESAFGFPPSGGVIRCIDSPVVSGPGIGLTTASEIVVVDCAGTFLVNTATAFSLGGSNQTMELRNLAMFGLADGGPGIGFPASGTLILENCVIEDFGSGTALDLEPNGPLHFVIKNSRISNNGSGILLKPQAGGSITVTLDHVTITGNSGGGIKADSTNGVVDLDITDSVVSNNGGNGINAIGGAGGQNIVSIKNSVIARNGAAGVQANGANAGVLIATTLLDQNAAGALSVVSGGNMFTYGNNQIVGSAGSGFNHTAGLQ